MKKELGQFYTTNAEYILQGLTIPQEFHRVIEPFVGEGHLLPFLLNFPWVKRVKCYDIDPKIEDIPKRDTLRIPPKYEGEFVFTNPPYLARNKAPKELIPLFEQYGVNDLYKCFLKTLIEGNIKAGILIIPLNFFCSQREIDISLRNEFLSKYKIIRLNIFEEVAFVDTSYAICSFSFEQSNELLSEQTLKCVFFPSKEYKDFQIKQSERWLIGGSLYYPLMNNSSITIGRLLKSNKEQKGRTNIFLHAIDNTKKIQLEWKKEIFYGKDSDRSFATLWILPPINEEKQKKLIEKFNQFLEEKRNEYRSLFLTNYREKKRKRITFDLVYQWVKAILHHL